MGYLHERTHSFTAGLVTLGAIAFAGGLAAMSLRTRGTETVSEPVPATASGH